MIHFVIPKGYQGVLVIELDEEAGNSVNNMGGRFVYVIPESGVLKVRSLEPFLRWHKQTASFSDDSTIPYVYVEKDVDQEKQYLWFLFNRSGNRLYYFLGTKAERDKFIQQYR